MLNNDNYFVPIPEKTRIETDRLVMAFEGSSVKPLLPDIRANTTQEFKFQIIDYYDTFGTTVLRQNYTATLTWSDDFNGCTLPADCFVEEDGSMRRISFFTATSIALFSLLSF